MNEKDILTVKAELLRDIETQVKADIKYFRKLKKPEDYCRGRIEEAKFLLQKIRELF